MSQPPHTPPADEGELPRTLGPYRIVGLLGEGGMGVVYRAEDPETGKEVALKTVLVPNERWLSNIRLEIRTLAHLRHPGVVRIVATGLEEGLPWYAMELIEGVSLDKYGTLLAMEASGKLQLEPAWHSGDHPTQILEPKRIKGALAQDVLLTESDEGSLSPEGRFEVAAGGALRGALTVIRRLCMVLGFVHGEGVVHRDLKPANIIIQPDGTLVLVDFGVISRFGANTTREEVQVGFQVGTAMYMAPEQAQGELVDARADLYSVGCLLYEMIAGRPVFVGDSAIGLSMQHICSVPEPPSRWVQGVSPELDELVMALLAKRPADRPGHATDVAKRLGELGAASGPLYAEHKPRPYLYRPELVGRQELQQQLRQHLQGLQRGEGKMVVLAGESGVGKTRLAQEAVRLAEQAGALVILGECLSVSTQVGSKISSNLTTVFQALQPLIQALADRCRERGPEETRRLLGPQGKLLALFEPDIETLPGLEVFPAPSNVPLAVAKLRLFGALADILGRFVQDTGLVVVLDDLHWADDLTLEWLDYLLRNSKLEQKRTLFLATYRSDEDTDALRPVLTHPDVVHLELGRLSPDQIRALVSGMLAQPNPPEDFVRFLAHESEGNPFFVSEYLRTAVAEGLLLRDSQGQWRLSHGREPSPAGVGFAEALALPHTLKELVLRRLEGLSEPARHLVDIAAVLGRDIRESVLLREIFQMSGETISEAIQETLHRRVLELRGIDHLQFVHEKLRDVAYQQIPTERRKVLHRLVAQVLENYTTEPDPAALGFHWEEAGRNDKAVGAYLKAAHEATQRFVYAEAERLYRVAVALIPTPTRESINALGKLSDNVLSIQGRYPEAIEACNSALSQARALDDQVAQSLCLQRLSRILCITGRLAEAEATCRESLDIQRRLQLLGPQGEGLGRLADIYYSKGDHEEAGRLYSEALGIHRQVGNLRAEGKTLTDLADIYHQQGRLDEARGLYEQAVESLRQIGDRRHEGIALTHLGQLLHDQQLPGPAEQFQRHALEIHRQVGDRRLEAIGLASLGEIHHSRGALSEALAVLTEALSMIRSVGDPHTEARMRALLARIYITQGELDLARHCTEEALSFHRNLGNRRSQSRLLALLGWLEYLGGAYQEAWILFEEGLALRGQFTWPGNLGEFLKGLGDVHAAQGQIREAEGYYTRSLEYYAVFNDRTGQWRALIYQARLNRRIGQDPEALESWFFGLEQQIQGAQRLIDAALCQCERGHLALAQDRSGAAFLSRARLTMDTSQAGPQSPLGRAVRHLTMAQRALDTGEALIAGERPEDFPTELMRRILSS